MQKLVSRDEIFNGDLDGETVQVRVEVSRLARFAGQAKITDGVAAGGAWYEVSFDTGELAGQRIWVTDLDKNTFIYAAEANDDGFLFNFGEGVEHAEGGALVKALDKSRMRFFREI